MTVADKPPETSTPFAGPARAAADHTWIAWTIIAGCGVIVAVMGIAGSAGRALGGGPAARLMAHVPDPLAALALGAGALTALFILWLLVPRGVRRRRKEDEEYEFYQEPPKVPAWVLIVVWALLLLPFAGIGYLLWHGSISFGTGGGPRAPHQALPGALPQLYSPLAGPEATASPPLWTVAVTALALCAGLGSLVLVLWILLGDRLAWWWAGPLPEGRREMLAGAVDESLDDLAREVDPRVAIIKCYRRFEQALARSRVPRAPWQTPMEFMREALRRLPLPPRAVQRLTELFEVARFSNAPLDPTDRSSAFESLVAIREDLEREKANAPAA
jgi:hypothetical protein